MRWTEQLWRNAACCLVLLLAVAVMLLPVCGPILCAHPCCPDHEPHCTISAELANACSAPEHVKAPAVQAENQHIAPAPVLPESSWLEAGPQGASAFASAPMERHAGSAPVPLRI
ncbi:MAG TPA: hypothetical protein VJS11_04670 [Acidobacteriaceae bacterium]|nr:hypothetical protein [Acidobacteriaceae bacterium]